MISSSIFAKPLNIPASHVTLLSNEKKKPDQGGYDVWNYTRGWSSQLPGTNPIQAHCDPIGRNADGKRC